VQFTRWKAHHLACCREASGLERIFPPDAATAFRYGRRLGLHCCYCCLPPMAILLVAGVMDLRAMAVAAAVITLERFAPDAGRIGRVAGTVAVGTGLWLIARSIVSG